MEKANDERKRMPFVKRIAISQRLQLFDNFTITYRLLMKNILISVRYVHLLPLNGIKKAVLMYRVLKSKANRFKYLELTQ